MWSIHTAECGLPINRSEACTPATTCMNLQDQMLRDRSQAEAYVSPESVRTEHPGWVERQKVEQWGPREGGGEFAFSGDGVSAGGDENAPQRDGGDGCTAHARLRDTGLLPDHSRTARHTNCLLSWCL